MTNAEDLFEAGLSDPTVEAITRELSAAHGHSPKMHDAGADLIVSVRTAVRDVVWRLRAAGVTDEFLVEALVTAPARATDYYRELTRMNRELDAARTAGDDTRVQEINLQISLFRYQFNSRMGKLAT